MRLSEKLFQSLIVKQKTSKRNSVIISLDKYQELQEEFKRFKNFIRNECKHIDEEVIQIPELLHITFCSFHTFNEYERLESRILLKDCYEKRIKPLLNSKPLILQIKGLDIWSGNVRNAHILYAKVIDQSNRLQTMANYINDQFYDYRVLKTKNGNNNSYYQKQPEVKLHLTFMSSEFPLRKSYYYFKDLCDYNKSLGFQDYQLWEYFTPQKRISFDANKIINKYKDYLFCELIIKDIEFNQRLNYELFHVLESIQLPQSLY